MKGIFIPEITVEMFRNACLESIEELMAAGEVYDIEYDPKSAEQDVPDISVGKWVSCSERLPDEETDVIVTRTFLGCKDGSRGWNNHIPPKTYVEVAQYFNGEWTALSDEYKVARNRHTDPIAWMPLPEPYREGGENNG